MYVKPVEQPTFLACHPAITDHDGIKTLDNEDECTIFFDTAKAVGAGWCKFSFDAIKGLVFGRNGEYSVSDSHHYIIWRDDKQAFEVLAKSLFDVRYHVTDI